MNTKPLDTIESHGNGGMSFSGRDAVEVFRLASMISALKLEAKGIRMSRGVSVLKIAKQTTGLRTNDRMKQAERLQVMLDNAKSAVLYVGGDES